MTAAGEMLRHPKLRNILLIIERLKQQESDMKLLVDLTKGMPINKDYDKVKKIISDLLLLTQAYLVDEHNKVRYKNIPTL